MPAYWALFVWRAPRPMEPAGYALAATIAVGELPHGVAVAPDGSRVYVANAGSNTISAIDSTGDEGSRIATPPTARAL